LKNGITIPLLSGNETMNNNWIAFINSKAPAEVKNQRLTDLVEKVKSNLVSFSASLIKAGDIPLVSREKFIEQLNKVHLVCSLKAGDFFRAELKKKIGDLFNLKASLRGDTAGSVTGSEVSSLKSRIPDFFKNCTNNTLLEKVNSFSLISKSGGLNIVCLDDICVIAANEVPQKIPPPQNKTQAVSSFDKVKVSGEDPQRISPNNGRKIPDQIDLPKEVGKVIEAFYKAPCDNVTDCARWFCTKFLNGPFARVEKVLNPQNQSDLLDGEASNAYNSELRRLLQVEAENELSDDGYNFIAVADNSGFDSSLAIDGVSEEASGYDPSIIADNKLDSNAFNSNSTAKLNETSKGNHIVGIIGNSFIFLIFIVFFVLL
jgi:hypothetical protein